MDDYIKQYFDSSYSEIHVKHKLINNIGDMFKCVAINHAINKNNAFPVLNTSTRTIVFVLGEGQTPVVSSSIAASQPDWDIYAFDNTMINRYFPFLARLPNLMTIDCPLEEWRSFDSDCLTFNTSGDSFYNPKNVFIIAFDYFDKLHHIFKGIDPLNVNMISLQSKTDTCGYLDDHVTLSYKDDSIKHTDKNVIKFWNFKRLYIKYVGNVKKWQFIVNESK